MIENTLFSLLFNSFLFVLSLRTGNDLELEKRKEKKCLYADETHLCRV